MYSIAIRIVYRSNRIPICIVSIVPDRYSALSNSNSNSGIFRFYNSNTNSNSRAYNSNSNSRPSIPIPIPVTRWNQYTASIHIIVDRLMVQYGKNTNNIMNKTQRLNSDRPTWEIIWKNIFYIWFSILPEHRRIGDKIFPCRCISIKNGDQPWGRCWPIYLESKPSLNCWIAVERAEIDDKDVFPNLVCIFVYMFIMYYRGRS